MTLKKFSILVLLATTTLATAETDPFAADDTSTITQPQLDDGATFSMRNASLKDVIRYTTEHFGLYYRVEKHAIVIGAPYCFDVETRIYPMSKDFIRILPPPDSHGLIENDKLHSFMESIGTTMHEGASVQFLSATRQLFIRQTRGSLRRIEPILDQLDPYQPRQASRPRIHQLLESIKFSDVAFNNASPEEIVKYLKRRSKEIDPGGVGVNIFLEQRTDEASVTGPEDPFAAGGGDDPFAAPPETDSNTTDVYDDPFGPNSHEREPLVIDFDNIPLIEAIRYASHCYGLIYRFDDNAVVVHSTNFPHDSMPIRIYPVTSNFDRVLPKADRRGHIENKRLRDHFQTLGVDFPDGTQIQYVAKKNLIVLTNTENNHQQMRLLLGAICPKLDKQYAQRKPEWRPRHRGDALQARVDRITIPKISFVDAHPRDVFRFLSAESRKHCPEGKGTNVIFLDTGYFHWQ